MDKVLNYKIKKTLEDMFEVSVGYRNYYPTENEIISPTLQFFLFYEDHLERKDICMYSLHYKIIHVSKNLETYREFDIIDCLEEIGLKFKSIDYEEMKLLNTDEYVDIISYDFVKPVKHVRNI